MGVQQPFLYESEWRDSRLPEKEFDPKAVTRASWEPKPRKPKQEGPLVSFNRHPDMHEAPTGRTFNFQPLSPATKSRIKWMRYIQLGLRSLEMLCAAGLLALMIFLTNVEPLTAWVLRITSGVVVISSGYAVFHLARPARARPPASSAAYQLFAGVSDLAAAALYAFGVLSVVNFGRDWGTMLPNQYVDYLVSAEFYGLIGAGGLHLVSLGISIWLGLVFRRIANMPPDMNPLEDHLTTRAHKRNKSSVTSGYTTMSSSTKRLSDPLEDRRRSGAPYEDLSRPPSIPFMHTRTNSRESIASSKRGSRVDLPSRQYQIEHRGSPRASIASYADAKRQSNPHLAQRGSYHEISLAETGSPTRPGAETPPQRQDSPARLARFTEAWYASESLIQRTQQRQRAMNAAERSSQPSSPATSYPHARQPQQQYEALGQRYDLHSDSEDDAMRPGYSDVEDDDDFGRSPNASMHPSPLRSNPALRNGAMHQAPPPTPPRRKTPFHSTVEDVSDASSDDDDDHRAGARYVLSEVSLNSRQASGSGDIADAKAGRRLSQLANAWGRKAGMRNSSIQTEDHFCAKPYGSLKPATPPVMVGAGRQVSSGNDFDLGAAGAYARRNVSGRAAEEGMAGDGHRYSRYSILND
ncbi:hypothetical protein F4780DRAFT_363695 [Xylariomycetidae sp. FL0641]|nr:hypothetical protein F4780DRAFT_363695 [Xylariomycetidae sp. FL0641]